MKPAPFAYHAPTSTEAAVALLAEHGGQARLLAGGQALMPLMASRRVRSRHLIDLNRVPELSRTDGRRIGALTRLRELESHPVIPLLAQAAALAGPVQVRNRATLGGALAHADPAAELPAVAVALGARVELHGSAVRSLPVEDFLLGPHRTAMDATEVLAAVEFPPTDAAFAIEKVSTRPGLALAGAVVVLGGDGCRIVLFGVAPTPVRPAEAEAALARGASPDEVADAAVAVLDPHTPRRLLARGAVARAVATVRDKVRHG
ncbi:FAD binding domain-containing protein [Nonomuraea sp. NPDC050556]|uniref:FAD binding domain-containing protein n=1 Tax=Nonomuraea sp. NPDC050556 TaxID=3364369 RepID=UPI0037A505A1